MKNKYVHFEDVHNLAAPQEIVPQLIKLFNPTSVVDIGCGLGTFLHCFKLEGVNDVLGIDGPWVNKELLKKYLNENEFLEKDLEKEFLLEKKYDLVLSLEVAEHLAAESSDIFIQNLISSGRIIIFSAAIPRQGGQNHVNEQWLPFWEEKFIKYGYVIHDILRPIFWDNPKIFWWYRQNMVIFTPADHQFNSDQIYNPLRKVVHYELFDKTTKRLHSIIRGELSTFSYLKLIVKSLIRRRKSSN